MKMIKLPILSTYFLLVRIVGNFMMRWLYVSASFVKPRRKRNQLVTGNGDNKCVVVKLCKIVFCASTSCTLLLCSQNFLLNIENIKRILNYLFLAVLGLRFCARAFSSCGERGPLFIAVRGPLTIAASLVEEHRLQTRRLSSCGSRA